MSAPDPALHPAYTCQMFHRDRIAEQLAVVAEAGQVVAAAADKPARRSSRVRKAADQ